MRNRRWLGPAFALAGLGLVPWTVFLVVSLPSHHVQTGYYDVAWGGFDVALAALLLATGIGLLRRALWTQSSAAAAGALLVCDAWFDVLGAHGGRERVVAICLAVVAELPTAAICFLTARDVEEVAGRAQRYALVARRLRLSRRVADSGATG